MSLVVSDRFDAELPRGERVEIPTPEGVPLSFTIAGIGERAYAFTIDALCIGLALLGLNLAFGMSGLAAAPLVQAILLLAFFVLRNGWFTLHELRGQGRTPGKRRARIRVVDARGGALRPIALVVRNLTRELELVLPLAALSDPSSFVGAGPDWVRWLAVLWVLGLVILPLVDRRHRRLGDLLAGTMVVRDPQRALLRDLAADRTDGGEAPPAVGTTFSTRQLEMYGIYELQVLEQLLREEPRTSMTIVAVAERIVAKIGWDGDLQAVGGARAFLEAFYRAQRARLEHDLSLGRARERKREGRLER
jgi:uncharacterized RDD family membrane protein YckC